MNKVMEYMAMGRPIVSFDLKEARVSAGDAAVYAPANDEAEFAKLIARLLDDPDERRRWARSAGPGWPGRCAGSSRSAAAGGVRGGVREAGRGRGRG